MVNFGRQYLKRLDDKFKKEIHPYHLEFIMKVENIPQKLTFAMNKNVSCYSTRCVISLIAQFLKSTHT